MAIILSLLSIIISIATIIMNIRYARIENERYQEALKASRNNFLNENQTVESRRLYIDPTKCL